MKFPKNFTFPSPPPSSPLSLSLSEIKSNQMGHSLSKFRRRHNHHHQNPSLTEPLPPPPPSTGNTLSIVPAASNHPIPSSAPTPTPPPNIPLPLPLPPPSSTPIAPPSLPRPPPPSYAFAANAPYPYPLQPYPPAPFSYAPPPIIGAHPNFHFPHQHNGFLGLRPPPPPLQAPPPPYVDHKSAKKIKNDVNVHKDTIRLALDASNSDSYLVSFTFDALVDGSFTIFYFAKEADNCTFVPFYPEIYVPKRIPFKKGLGQKFCQPSGTGIDLGFFDMDELSKPSANGDVFPLVISAESCSPSSSEDAESSQSQPPMSRHAQITQAVLVRSNGANFLVRVVMQILWVNGVRYELREIYGIANSDEGGFNDTDPGKECVICLTEPKDTAILPCRHMCMCSECAKSLRLQSNKCPICRQPIEELIEIKVDKESHQDHGLAGSVPLQGL